MSKKLFGDLMKYFDNGRNNVLGRGWQVVQLVMTFAIYFTVSGKVVETKDIIFYSMILFILMVVVGFIFNKMGLLAAESSSRNKDNPELMEILERVRNIEKKG